MLTPAQKVTIKAAIQAAPAVNAFYVNGDLEGLAGALNAEASPAFWAWRSDLTRADIYNKQNDLQVSGAQTGFWQWDIYKAQSVPEQNAWVQMFMGDVANMSQQNLRDGVGKIFTGSAAANAQRDHVLAIGRRKATFAEQALATGTGSTASPATMTFEGAVSTGDLINL